ncbi:hypothetical protein SDC9_106374 [bioreactor metagenome]|uniref:Pyridoxamine 5'-phosphate oxidase-like domain-containing protein n=1 Tax=bioreactor metagenome TaxID=1076179 RepID=A0A645B258_9ZZZZ
MDLMNKFNRIMVETKDMALATSVNDTPNVRVINFLYNPTQKGIVYFSSFKGLPKTVEFAQNNRVAFTTIPTGNVEQVRVCNATVNKSKLTVYDLKEAFCSKYPDYEGLISKAGNILEVFEIHFKEANVIIDLGISGRVHL